MLPVICIVGNKGFKVKLVLAIAMCFCFQSTAFSSQTVSFEDAKKIIVKIFSENKAEIAQEVRVRKPQFADASDDMVFSRGNCQDASEVFQVYLKNVGLDARLQLTKIHAFITMNVLKDGKRQEITIDPTFRQLYKPNFDPLWGAGFQNGALIGLDFLSYYENLQLPLVAVVLSNDLKTYLEGFALPPGWITANNVIPGAFPQFEEWYINRE